MKTIRSRKSLGLALVASLIAVTAARADITIGLVAPLTGPIAAYGDQVKNGAQAAVDNINKSGGIGGDLGYPSTVELADGSFLTVWYERMRESPKAVLRQARWKLA